MFIQLMSTGLNLYNYVQPKATASQSNLSPK